MKKFIFPGEFVPTRKDLLAPFNWKKLAIISLLLNAVLLLIVWFLYSNVDTLLRIVTTVPIAFQ